MGMKLREKKTGFSTSVQVSGKVESSDAIALSRRLESLSKKKNRVVVLDLSGIHFLDSHWLGVLVYCWKLFRDQERELLFVVPPGPIRGLFSDACLDKTFRIYATLSEALSA